jgi:hypothetical protein
VQFHVFEHGVVQQVLQAGLVVAVEEGKAQRLVAGLAEGVGVALQLDAILGQRAGLV